MGLPPEALQGFRWVGLLDIWGCNRRIQWFDKQASNSDLSLSVSVWQANWVPQNWIFADICWPMKYSGNCQNFNESYYSQQIFNVLKKKNHCLNLYYIVSKCITGIYFSKNRISVVRISTRSTMNYGNIDTNNNPHSANSTSPLNRFTF